MVAMSVCAPWPRGLRGPVAIGISRILRYCEGVVIHTLMT